MLFYLLSFVLLLSPADDCDKHIKKEIDKLNEDINYKTPLLEPVSATRILKKGQQTVFLKLATWSSTVSVKGKGVTILFDNGKRIERPNQEIDAQVNTTVGHPEDYEYTAFMELTPEDIALLSQARITNYKLNTYSYELKDNKGQVFREAMSCLMNAK